VATFRKLCELANQPGRDFWDHKKSDKSHLDDQSMSVIHRGLEIRPDRTEGNTFWDDFVSVLGNNSEGASKLLGVSTDIIAGWSSRIKEGLAKTREDNEGEKKPMVKTGAD